VPGIIGITGWDRSSAWTWVFSSTHSTSARSGGFKYRPTMSRTFSTTCGSADSLTLSCRCGLSPNARQIRDTADWLIPVARAIDRVDQCVAVAGRDSNVFTITSSTRSSVTVRGAPGRGSSDNPSRRRSTNRARHLPTVAVVTENRSATTMFGSPRAQASTIRDRSANACDDVGRRAHRRSVSRSSSLRSRAALGRPR
jgi:hypothetical protein